MTYRRIREIISKYLPQLFRNEDGTYFITKTYKDNSFNACFSFLSSDDYSSKTLTCCCKYPTSPNLFMSITFEGPEQLIQIINDYITLVDSFIKTSENSKLNAFPKPQ